MNKTFTDFHLKSSTMAFIEANHFVQPTDIQQAVIPPVLRGKDVAGLSRTGSGKTHAFLIPIMEMLDPSKTTVQAVVTAPTRELAMQLYEHARKMHQVDERIIVRLYVGGTDREKELKQLKTSQPHVVIGTPGRIKDLFLEEGVLRLDQANILVVDEADMTLEYGFLDEIDAFAGRMKENLQMLAFSATIPEQLKPFLKRYMHHPELIRMEDPRQGTPITHYLVPCYHHSFGETILKMMEGLQPYVCLIFANTRQEAASIAQTLRDHGVGVSELHGDLESRKRKQALKQLQAAQHTYVVATDLAARGIDVAQVTHVISCGFPQDLSYYIHRAGRTGRYDQTGVCYALYHEEDDASIRSLQKRGIKFQHVRFHQGAWHALRPYGEKRVKKDDALSVQISKMMTKKNTKVKPGYKKKRERAIATLEQKKRREFIRQKIKEERTAMYKRRAKELKEHGE